MPEAVIVSAARSPIGRAFKGSLKDLRPDDLTATIIQAALAKVPELDPRDIDDLMLGCGLPGGEQGHNLGRIVAVQMGMDHLPGCTITRYCSSSLQTTRMALHAIKAGEGDVFISAGVEMVSRFVKGNSDSLPDTHNPLFAEAEARTAARRRAGAAPTGTTRARTACVPDAYIAMGQTAENLARAQGRHPPGHGRVRRPLAEPRRGGHQERLLGARDHPGHAARTARSSPRTTARARASPWRASRASSRSSAPTALVTAGNCCPLNDGAAALVIMSDTKARELGLTPLARIVSTGVSGLSPEIMGLGPVEASKQALRRPG